MSPRNLLTLSFFSLCLAGNAQHSLTKIWTSDTILRTPESVLFDPAEKLLWVSCIDGAPSGADGKGQIAQVKTNGSIIDANWVTGLNCPKGMARVGKYLYVSDLTELVVIDIPNRKIEKKVPVEGAVFLNDVTANKKGEVFVSDMKTGKVHVYHDGKMEVWLENLNGPNGLLSVGSDLYILTSGSLQVADANKQLKTLAEGMDKSTDGIEQTKSGDFVVSCWSGAVYYLGKDMKPLLMLDTRPNKKNTADIGFDPETNQVFVPTFFGNHVAAYQLK
jgi:hypothetical protein